MLSRTAENLFWLARYMERADTMARLLEVGYRMALMPSAGEGYRNEWASLVAAAGSSSGGFEAKFGETFRQRDIDRPLSYERMAEDTAAVLRHLGVADADILGWSDGGIVALGLAARIPTWCAGPRSSAPGTMPTPRSRRSGRSWWS